MSYKMKRLYLVMSALMIAALACGTFNIGFESNSSGGGSSVINVANTPEQPPVDDGDVVQINDDDVAVGEPPVNIGKSYWSEVVDERTGVRFAVPCFWTANIPASEQDPSGLGAFSVSNFNEAWVQSLGPKAQEIVWESGGVKIDIGYNEFKFWNLPAGSSLDEFVAAFYPEDEEFASSDLIATEPVRVNGQEGLMLTAQGREFGDIWSYYLFPLAPEYVFYFSVYPPEALRWEDIQGVLNSIALTSEVEVSLPNLVPARPPEGVDAPCLKGLYESSDIGDLTGKLACPVEGGAGELACEIQDALLARDIPQIASLMADPFGIGYWMSEWVSRTAQEAANEFDRHRLPADTQSLTFTTDRNLFPTLHVPPERMMNPELTVAMVIYSEGWGSEGEAGALLFIIEEADNTYSWYAMLEYYDR
jgi:hypothetical protein